MAEDPEGILAGSSRRYEQTDVQQRMLGGAFGTERPGGLGELPFLCSLEKTDVSSTSEHSAGVDWASGVTARSKVRGSPVADDCAV